MSLLSKTKRNPTAMEHQVQKIAMDIPRPKDIIPQGNMCGVTIQYGGGGKYWTEADKRRKKRFSGFP
jgi:hypothetical protein